MEEAVYADRVLIMSQGKVAEVGSPSEIFLHRENLHEMGVEKPNIVKLSEDLRSLELVHFTQCSDL